jgi:hypothetical protein
LECFCEQLFEVEPAIGLVLNFAEAGGEPFCNANVKAEFCRHLLSLAGVFVFGCGLLL